MNIFWGIKKLWNFLGGWGRGRGFIEESDDFGASSLCILGYFNKVKLPHYLQKTPKFRFASQKHLSLQKN